MVLAGASVNQLEMISRYAMPIGIAFQIKDDLLGIFGSEAEVGKPITSDLEEGKKTLLTVFAQSHGNQTQRNRIASLLGKHPISTDDLNDARGIFQEIGAVSYCEALAQELVCSGKEALERINLRGEIAVLLAGLANHVTSRTI
jgi:geranylgeranyl diphosphate synthase type I